MKYNKIVIVLILAFLSAQAIRTTDNMAFESQPYGKQEESWFEEQMLDHFVPLPYTTYWSQRYFILPDYFDAETGPMFLYICGEGACSGMPSGRSFTKDLAEKHKGIVVTLEHRFYGASQPFGQDENSYSTKNLKYLTQEQGLADLAVFIGWIKQQGFHGITENTPVITVGGSYAGAMSAWFRFHYKHLTIGAYSSSGVVEAIEDFYDYDKQIGISTGQLGNYCPEDIRTLNDYVQEQLADPLTSQELKSKFRAEQLTDLEFLEMFADIFSIYVQYGNTKLLCESILKDKTINQQLSLLSLASFNPESYTVDYLKKTQYSKNSNARQWFYQTCTAFGWFQTAYIPDPMRSLLVDLDYFENKCKEVFGDDFVPDVPLTNEMMGGRNYIVDNVIFTNGGEDPWQWASITKDELPMKAYVAECIGCGHCCDLSTPRESDPIELKYVREQVEININQWLEEYRQKTNQNMNFYDANTKVLQE